MIFEGKMLALIDYAKQLTLPPATLTQSSIRTLRKAGADESKILEVNQVAA